MAREWTVLARGGPYDGYEGQADPGLEPGPLLILWRCSDCQETHGAFDANDPDIVLRTAEPYRWLEFDFEQRVAVYRPASPDDGPVVEDEALVGTGAGA